MTHEEYRECLHAAVDGLFDGPLARTRFAIGSPHELHAKLAGLSTRVWVNASMRRSPARDEQLEELLYDVLLVVVSGLIDLGLCKDQPPDEDERNCDGKQPGPPS